MCRACLFNTVWRARHDTYDTCLLRASSNARKWCVRSLISSKQQCKCFVTNDSFIVFACYSSVIAKKNVIDAVQSEGIPNQIGSLRRKMTTIDDGHVGMWTRHARHVTWRAEWNLGLRQRTVEVCVCVCVCVACVQQLLSFMIRRIRMDRLLNYVDLCSTANISVLIVFSQRRAFYIHGQCVHRQSDVSLADWYDNFLAEQVLHSSCFVLQLRQHS